MYCSACGKAIEIDSTFCKYCGKATGLSNPSINRRLTTSTIECPKCGQSDKVYRAKSIVREGMVSGTIPVRHVGVVGEYIIETTANHKVHSTSSLTQYLTPLSERDFDKVLEKITANALKRIKVPDLVGPTHFLLEAKALKAEKDRELRSRATWIHLMNRTSYSVYMEYWNKLYYCGRCGVVCVEGINRTEEAEDASAFLLDLATDSGSDRCTVAHDSIGMWGPITNRLTAVVESDSNIYIAAEITWKDKGHPLWVTAGCKNCQYAVEILDDTLQAQGWPQIGIFSKNWHRARLSRLKIIALAL